MSREDLPLREKGGLPGHEVMIRDAEAEAMARILIREQVRFAFKPEPNGWVRVRAWYVAPYVNTAMTIESWAQEARAAS